MSGDQRSRAEERARLEEPAIAWLIEREEGFTAERRQAFDAWLAGDPRRAATVRRLEQSLAVLEELPAYRVEMTARYRGAPRDGESRASESRKRVRRLGWLALGGMAAALVLAGAIGWGGAKPEPEQPFVTAPAAPRRVTLADGSVLELNGATRARVRYTARERRVELEAGEAHFAVAPDAARPFTVVAGDLAVRAVGTAFNVRRDAQAAEVLVVEGKVTVASPGRTATAKPVLVEAGERAVVTRERRDGGAQVDKVDAAAIREALRWQPVIAEFADEPLRDVVLRFNRRNRIQLVVSGAELAGCRVAGVFSLEEPEAFVRLLERDGVLVGERRGEDEILLRKR